VATKHKKKVDGKLDSVVKKLKAKRVKRNKRIKGTGTAKEKATIAKNKKKVLKKSKK